MQNVEIQITDDNRLILTVDLSQQFGVTKGGASVRIGSSEGNCRLWVNGKPHPEGVFFNLNVCRPLTAEQKKARRREFFR
jgi:hypothetical protein